MSYERIHCQICGAAGQFKPYKVQDQMFENGPVYDYLNCISCGSMQIADMPDADFLDDLYHNQYYSFQQSRVSTLKKLVQAWRDSATMQSGPWIERLLGEMPRRFQMDPVLETLSALGVHAEDRILDIGCGAGRLIDRLARAGFSNVQGADPFIEADMKTPAGVQIHKSTVEFVVGEFDVIMFNHSFEHITQPGQALADAIGLLAPGGRCIVRVPTTSSEAWDMYQENWVQLDAPRHTVIPSREGMERLAARLAADLVCMYDDSTEFQFSGSELYQRGLSLFVQDGDQKKARDTKQVFAAEELKSWREKATTLNAMGRGDQTAFVLQKVG